MTKKTWDQVTVGAHGKEPYDGEMYYVDTSVPSMNKMKGPNRWRIYRSPWGWRDYTGTDPVSDDGVIISGSIAWDFNGVDAITFTNDSDIDASAYTVAATTMNRIDKHHCQCGVWKTGGIHYDWCERAGQSDPGTY